MTTNNTPKQAAAAEVAGPNKVRIAVIGVLLVASFFGAYKFASALTQQSEASQQASAAAAIGAGDAQVAGAVAPGTAGAQGAQGAGAVPGGSAAQGGTSSGSGAPGCACCGSSQPTQDGVSGEKTAGKAVVAGGVQKIDVDVSTGVYSPNVITLKAGVPAEITFANGSGCTAQVMSKELGFFEDISQGPKTVKLGALKAGEYPFSCGMQMVYGKIVVE